jgi:hypothetical protein
VSGLVARHQTATVDEPAAVWARIVPAAEDAGLLLRSGRLTPYLAQTLTEDVVHAGPGARLELALDANASDGMLAALQAWFSPLEARGFAVAIARGDRTAACPPLSAASSPTTAAP